MKRVVFYASGNGTNAENLIRTIRAGKIAAVPAAVICDNPGAGVLERARKFDVETVVVDRKKFASKQEFEAALIRETDLRHADVIALAGFMRILSEAFVTHYLGRLINIHPSYLPDFRGAHAIRDAFEAKVKETGVTVHFVVPEVDAGPVILQRRVPVKPGDTLEALEARVHAVEYELYPDALNLLLTGKAVFPS